MKKRILSILLVLIMAIALIPSVFAANDIPEHEVRINNDGTYMKVRRDGTDWSAGAKELTIQTSEMTNPFDYIAALETQTIKDSIIEWYQYGESLITDRVTSQTAQNALRKYFNEWAVTGEFTVTIKFPTQITGGDLANHLDTTRKDMYGFNDEAKTLFEETARTVTAEGSNTVITITIAIKDADGDGKPGITEQALYEGVTKEVTPGKTQYLNELTYTVENVIPGTFSGALTVDGKMTGKTTFQIGVTADPKSDTVEFYTDDLRATLVQRTTGSTGSVDKIYKITFNIDGRTDEIDPIYKRGTVDKDELPYPTKPGFTFEGWYKNSDLTDKVDPSISVFKDIILYGHWVSDTLLTDDHFAYIIGYPDETVRPERNITREEATMIFYRLLRDNVRDSIFTLENDFTDILPERWSNSALSTMQNGGYVTGRPGGAFDPEAPITRAEFATMAVRFAALTDTSGASFTDISGHWAERYILQAATAGWIKGYPDGSFDPDAYITRAEAMTLVNNVLMRHVNEEGLHADTRKWIDMKGDEWYYYIVLEATNSHDFVRQADGYNETWTAILPNKTWK